MRRVVRDYTKVPDKLRTPSTLADLESIAISGNTKKIKSSIYFDPYKTNDGNKSRVLDQLELYYLGKCAYCERLYKLDVEHYRPKGRITDENGKKIASKGYYWLCYEWSNLLPSCISCNREGGKVDKFPILGTRVTSPSFYRGKLNKALCLITSKEFSKERPFLLNPEIDNPTNFFNFKISDKGKGIEIVGKDKLLRGEKTIQICKLNRYELRLQRAQIISEFAHSVHILFKRYQTHGMTNKQFVECIIHKFHILNDLSKKKNLEHTLLRKYILKSESNFNTIVLPFIAKNLRNVLLDAFKKYKTP